MVWCVCVVGNGYDSRPKAIILPTVFCFLWFSSHSHISTQSTIMSTLYSLKLVRLQRGWVTLFSQCNHPWMVPALRTIPRGGLGLEPAGGNFTWMIMSSAVQFHGDPFISFWLITLSGHCSECPHLYLLVETFSSNRFWVSSLKLRSCIHFYFGLLLEVKGKDVASFSDMQLFS